MLLKMFNEAELYISTITNGLSKIFNYGSICILLLNHYYGDAIFEIERYLTKLSKWNKDQVLCSLFNWHYVIMNYS